MRSGLRMGVAFVLGMVVVSRVGAVEPVKPVAVKDDEKAAQIAKETDDQKKLRADLAELTKKGEKLYFASTVDGKLRVYGMGLDGTKMECLTPAPTDSADKPHVSPDGKKLVINVTVSKEDGAKLPQDASFKRGGQTAIATLDLATKKITPVVLGDNAYWHPNGKTICYNTDGANRKIGIFNLEKNEEKVVNGMPGSVMFPNFSPDGKWLLGGGYPFSLVAINADGTAPAEGAAVKKLSMSGCNNEISKDGKSFVYVIDTFGECGGWLYRAEFDPTTAMKAEKLPLGWPEQSVNYYPDLSPDGKYMVYSHAEMKQGVESWKISADQEIYITTYPDCKTTVRVTWNRANNVHPVWVK